MMRSIAHSLLFLLVSAFALAACDGEPTALTQARKEIADGKWSDAHMSLAKALKESPQNLKARALSLYLLDKQEGLEEITKHRFYNLVELLRATQTEAWQNLKDDFRAEQAQEIVDARKALFEKGIDTKDNADLMAVLASAAAFGYERDEAPRKDFEAAILAARGDQDAVRYLVGRLKGKETAQLTNYLLDVGPPAVAELRKVAADKGHLGRRAAADALALLLAGQRVHALMASYPQLDRPDADLSKVAGKERLANTRLFVMSDLSLLHNAHVQYAPLNRGDDDGLILLQAWDDEKGALLTELHSLRGGQLQPLKILEAKPATPPLAGHLLFGLAANGNEIIFRRELTKSVTVEVYDPSVDHASPGLRIRLRGEDRDGEIVREDSGLWLVKLDQPLGGMSEVSVATSKLMALKKEPQMQTQIETFTAELRGNELHVIGISSERAEAADSDSALTAK